MKNLKVTWKGTTPLLMHSCQCVNPMHPISVEMKKYTSKRKKTDEDLKIISDLEWRAGAYWDENIGLYIPAENIEATLINGAKANRKGTDFQKYCDVTDLCVPLSYGENLSLEELIADYRYRDTRVMNVQRAKVLRTRPRFNQWQITFNLRYDENRMDLATIINAMDYAGSFVGLCDSRPKYGKFVSVFEEID